MKIKDLSKKPLLRDFLLMFLFGVLSYLFGLVKFYIPGLEGALSDLRELPLLVSIFHLSNPLFAIGISAISSIGTPADGSYITTFLMHSIALMISWVFFNYLNKHTVSIFLMGLITFFSVFIYYLAFLFPVLIIVNHLVGLNLDSKFIKFYIELASASEFEIITTSLVVSLYLVQHKLRFALKKHMSELEETVKTRTKDLNSAITKLKDTQQYLVQSEKMSSLGTLSAGVAHEINNPLNFISCGNHLIKNIKNELYATESSDLVEKCEKATGMIEEGIKRASGIVKSLMNFSLNENSEIQDTDIHEVIEDTLLFLNYKIPQDINIKRDFQLITKIPIYIDKIHQVVLNIIENAIFELNSVSDKQKIIKISTNQNKNNAIIEISNNGIQIPDEIINQIFDPFFTTKDPGQGVGLGLSICYSLIAEHNGKISAENTDFGVSIILELPLK